MFRCVVPLILVLPFCGCGSKPGAPTMSNADQGRRAEIRIGGSEEIPPKHLPFKIVAIHRNRKPIEIAPFHAAYGDWTFFDCQAKNEATFLIGTMTKSSPTGSPLGWGRAILAVNDNEAGRQFVELFAEAFGGTSPPASSNQQPPKPLFINTAILAENAQREPLGGFSEATGGWTATKWFPSNDLAEAEVYFNFNFDQRQGEFSEKDADYADDLLSIFAAALRDGPRPPRTPENDPNLALVGPAIGRSRQLLKRRTSFNTFTPDSRFAVYEDRERILALSVEDLEGEPIEVARFDYSPWRIDLVNNEMDLLVQEGVSVEQGVRSSADPMRFWWVNQATKEKKLLRGPEKELGLTEKPLSPDYRFVAFDQYFTDPKNRSRNKVLHFLDRTTGAVVTVQLPKIDLGIVGWKESAVGVRAVGVTNRWGFDKDQPSESFLIDPISGKMERQEQPKGDTTPLLSPDGKHRIQFGDGQITITNLGSGEDRKFSFHEEDRPFAGMGCVEWVSPDFLKFRAPRLALIDVRTMKMNYPVAADGSRFHSASYTFSPDFRRVLYQGERSDGEGLFHAPVTINQ